MMLLESLNINNEKSWYELDIKQKQKKKSLFPKFQLILILVYK